MVTSDFQPDPCDATPVAPINAAPHPDELQRGDLKDQTPRTARAVLDTKFDVDSQQILPAYMVDVSPSQSRRSSREPTSSSRNVSGNANATGPGECASHNSLYHEAAVRQETGWDQSLGEIDPTVLTGRCVTSPRLCSRDDVYRRVRRYRRTPNARFRVLLAAPLFLSAVDAFPFYGRRKFVFLRQTGSRCGNEPPMRGPPDVTTGHARVRLSRSQAIWTKRL